MNVHKICDTIQPILDKHKNEEHVEMEFRLGKYNGTFFDTNIGEKMYINLLKGLNKYSGWDRIETSQTDVFFREKDNLRITIDETTNEETIVKKERVHIEDFKQIKDTPFVKKFLWNTIMKVKWMVKKRKHVHHIFVKMYLLI